MGIVENADLAAVGENGGDRGDIVSERIFGKEECGTGPSFLVIDY